jgi:hypothetical protein
LRLLNARDAIDPTSGGSSTRTITSSRAGTGSGAAIDASTDAGSGTCADADSRTDATRECLGIDRGECEPADVNCIQSKSDHRRSGRNRYLAEQRHHDAHIHFEQRRVEFGSDPSGRVVQHAVQHRRELSVSLHDSPEYGRSRQRAVTRMETRPSAMSPNLRDAAS